MRVSQKCEYAMRAVLELTLRDDPSLAVRTADIAKRQQIPEKFLELILVELRRAGLITSQRGPVGGHRLARRPSQITVGDVWRAVEDTLTERAATGKNHAFRSVWDEVNAAVAGVVDQISFEDIRRRSEAARGVMDFNI